MTFEKFDLNLLKVFSKVMETGSYLKASEALEISPPAVSIAMKRLQTSLDKELFVRGGGQIQPTAAAKAFYRNTRLEFLSIEKVIRSYGEFEPHSSKVHFTLSSPEEYNSTLLSAFANEKNSGLTYSLKQQASTDEEAITSLRTRATDLVIDSVMLADSSIESSLLFEDRIVLIAAKANHTIGESLTLEQYQKLPQSVLNIRRNGQLALEMFRDDSTEIHRNISHEASSLMANMLIVSQTMLFGHVPLRLALRYQEQLALKIIEPPIKLKPVPIIMQWHKSNSIDPSHMWLRNRIKQILLA
ncbi:LysR family transcriptional regulator [Shewanella sp. Isolate13]|uniref:LysR family transcriptional regulator n=1 Tax=Shewanella sp. Isolate13 TaxID=2908531 RepID=UPI001EFD254E|nr:LysR family transcriptional regulator [Shewanella sp. Isolate13]MCG9732068.1 LysR family transcriptional regulator [Shewanella sp. Isolate13]